MAVPNAATGFTMLPATPLVKPVAELLLPDSRTDHVLITNQDRACCEAP